MSLSVGTRLPLVAIGRSVVSGRYWQIPLRLLATQRGVVPQWKDLCLQKHMNQFHAVKALYSRGHVFGWRIHSLSDVYGREQTLQGRIWVHLEQHRTKRTSVATLKILEVFY